MNNSQYQRQISLNGFGLSGQKKLNEAKVLIVGMGGLGCPIAQYLCAAGVGTLGLSDFDRVSLSNLPRQILFQPNQVNQFKVDAASEVLLKLNPSIQIQKYYTGLTSENASHQISSYDLIIDASDDLETKFLINDTCLSLDKPWIYGSINQFDGQFAAFHPKKGSACFRCFLPSMPKAVLQNCETAGVLGPVVGIIANFQCTITLQILAMKNNSIFGSFFTLNAQNFELNSFKLEQRQNCSCTNKQSNLYPESVSNESLSLQNDEDILEVDFILPEEVVIDVREPMEWQQCFFSRSIPLALSQIQNGQLPELPTTAHIVLVCKAGVRSLYAAEIFKAAGFKNTKSYYPGIKHLIQNYEK